MCFSVGASFTAGAALTIIGLLSLKKAPPRYRLFACIPFLFAIQQFAEGFLWLVFTGMPKGSPFVTPVFLILAPLAKAIKIPDYVILIKKTSILVFLIFAFVIWPTWIPLACWRFEGNKIRKWIITGCLILGGTISGVLLFSMLNYGAKAAVVEGHIVYTITGFIPYATWFNVFLYTVATVGPLFVTSLPSAWLLGGAIIISEIMAWHFWQTAFVSTWCFFAAILSVIIFALIPEKK